MNNSTLATAPSAVRRARDLGIITGRLKTGRHNAITDVEGVLVGHSTLISGESSPDEPVRGVVRTGVTAVYPHLDVVNEAVYAGCFSLNGNGELTGTAWIDESGLLTTPVCLTNTHSVGVVRDAMIAYFHEKTGAGNDYWMLPVVGETWDGWLSDINGMHVRPEHVYEALDSACGGPVAEGNVGGGTGMMAHEFKGGIGTSSRLVEIDGQVYTVGVLVQANYGERGLLRIDGVPVGREIPVDLVPGKEQMGFAADAKQDGSIIILAATDAPLVADQCRRLAKRAALGLARLGSIASDSSGDLFLAFSTHNRLPSGPAVPGRRVHRVETLGHDSMTPLFEGVVEATEEAIINSLCAAETISGIKGRTGYALPLDMLRDLLKRFGWLAS